MLIPEFTQSRYNSGLRREIKEEDREHHSGLYEKFHLPIKRRPRCQLGTSKKFGTVDQSYHECSTKDSRLLGVRKPKVADLKVSTKTSRSLTEISERQVLEPGMPEVKSAFQHY